MIGDTIEHYRVLGKLGAGGMGEVYKAEDTRLGRFVALKFLPEALAGQPEMLARFRREAQACSVLNHPNICTIYDIGEQSGRAYIALEYLEGATLKDLLAQGRLELDQIIDFSMQIADALDAAHSGGIVHRDLKPANIFITGRKQAKVLDFGVAKMASSWAATADGRTTIVTSHPLTLPGATIGTVAYMSPEQVRGKDLDARSDLFSLGVVLYEMATGVMPFRGETSGVISSEILNTQPVSPLRLNPDLPPKLVEIIHKALEKDRELRYQHAAEIRTDLKRLRRETDSGWEAAAEPSTTRMGDLAEDEANRTFVGRKQELSALQDILSDSGPAIVYLHGIAGIGKSRLIYAFAERARNHHATVTVVDCRTVEPTEQGFLRALATRFGRTFHSVEDAARLWASLGSPLVLALDHYEVLRLLDAWLRQSFVPRLPSSVRIILADREPPTPAWAARPGWEGLFRTLELDALSRQDSACLLARLGIPESRAGRIDRLAQGHPLALTLAASSRTKREDPAFEELAIHRVIHELTQLYLAEISDPTTRNSLEAASVLRRVTVSLVRAMLPDVQPQEAFWRLRSLPFIHFDLDGLHIHDAVKQVLATALRSSDPSRYRDYRRAAWAQLRKELATAAISDFWRYTADMLYLLENPAVREAFFPSGAQLYAVEPARPPDGAAIRAIAERHEGQESLRWLCEWWTAAPETFSAVRDRDGRTVGFYCLAEASAVARSPLKQDPVVSSWLVHLGEAGLEQNETALFLRRWLSESEGELPSPVQAACWLDVKRTYLELRPRLRRVYLTVRTLEPYAAAAQTLGFVPLPSASVSLDGCLYQTAMLDFGPASVDGWLARLVAAELGVSGSDVFDVEARELVTDGARVPLTKLEFAVLHYLREQEGRAVAREALIRDVWGHKYDVGSNVVEAVVKSLRKKLGPRSDLIETVAGYGYKLRATV